MDPTRKCRIDVLSMSFRVNVDDVILCYLAVCRLEVDVTKWEGIMTDRQIPASVRRRSNDTGEPIDCTFVIYAPKAHRVSQGTAQIHIYITVPW